MLKIRRVWNHWKPQKSAHSRKLQSMCCILRHPEKQNNVQFWHLSAGSLLLSGEFVHQPICVPKWSTNGCRLVSVIGRCVAWITHLLICRFGRETQVGWRKKKPLDKKTKPLKVAQFGVSLGGHEMQHTPWNFRKWAHLLVFDDAEQLPNLNHTYIFCAIRKFINQI